MFISCLKQWEEGGFPFTTFQVIVAMQLAD